MVGHEIAIEYRDNLAMHMTPSQLTEGKKSAIDLAERYAPAPTKSAAHEMTSGSSLVESIQQRLLIFGYKPGQADGIMGAETRGAIRRFQLDNSLPVTAEASDWLLEKLEILQRLQLP